MKTCILILSGNKWKLVVFNMFPLTLKIYLHAIANKRHAKIIFKPDQKNVIQVFITLPSFKDIEVHINVDVLSESEGSV